VILVAALATPWLTFCALACAGEEETPEGVGGGDVVEWPKDRILPSSGLVFSAAILVVGRAYKVTIRLLVLPSRQRSRARAVASSCRRIGNRPSRRKHHESGKDDDDDDKASSSSLYSFTSLARTSTKVSSGPMSTQSPNVPFLSSKITTASSSRRLFSARFTLKFDDSSISWQNFFLCSFFLRSGTPLPILSFYYYANICGCVYIHQSVARTHLQPFGFHHARKSTGEYR
jgi:hypothetical protein